MTSSARRDRARALAAFYASGGALSALSLTVPGWPGRSVPGLLAVAAAALTCAAVLLAVAPAVGDLWAHALVAAGSGLIGCAMVAGGGGAASVAYAGFFVWVAAYAFLFFEARQATAHVLLGVAVELGALLVVGDGAVAPAQVVLSLGTLLSTGTVIGVLTRRVQALAICDALTGLPNRRGLPAALATALARADRSGRPLTVLALDLDGFKALNDSRGHAAGDELLVRCARSWRAQLRGEDLLARLGGDEFVAVLPDCSAELAGTVAGRLVAATPAPLSVCVGIAVHEPEPAARPADPEAAAVRAQALLRRADRALYAGKGQGRGSVRLAAPRRTAPVG